MPSGFSAVIELLLSFLGENLLNITALVVIGLFIFWFVVSRPKELQEQQEMIDTIRKSANDAVDNIKKMYDNTYEQMRKEHKETMNDLTSSLKIGSTKREDVQYDTIGALKDDNAELVRNFIDASSKFREVMGELGAKYDSSLGRADDTIERNTQILRSVSSERDLHEKLLNTQLQLVERQLAQIQVALEKILEIGHKLDHKIEK